MDLTIILIVGFWSLLFLAYAAWPSIRRLRGNHGYGPRPTIDPALNRQYRWRVEEAVAAMEQPRLTPAFVPRLAPVTEESQSSEVDVLRAQVKQLKSELVAMSSPVSRVRPERPYLRRYPVGAYTQLPRHLRRQVRVVRSTRHAIK